MLDIARESRDQFRTVTDDLPGHSNSGYACGRRTPVNAILKTRIDSHRSELASICAGLGVRRLELFGSAVRSEAPGPRRRKSRSKRERRELADLIKAAGGVEGLRKLLEDNNL